MRIKSLTARVLLLTTVWSTVALVVIGLLISTLYRKSAERGFQDLLRAQLYNVINSVTIGDQGALSGSPQLGDLRFAQPKTGWYWVVEPLGTYTTAPLVSPSLGSALIPVPSVVEAPFDKNYERYYQVTDASGNRVQVAETEVVLDTDGRAARPRHRQCRCRRGRRAHLFAQPLSGARRFRCRQPDRQRAGDSLRPEAARQGTCRIERIRAGESEQLKGDFPREILPLANEVNALIDSNRRIVERARMQVGNLAHSLKTPIAVLLNEARVLEKSHGELVRSQAEAMQGQVQSYLNRARIAAQRESVLARTDAEPALERLVRVMRRLNVDTEFDLVVSPPHLAVAMEQQDLEETVGNLLENAARFAKSRVRLSAVEAGEDVKGVEASARRHWVELAVEDDGPGLEPDQIREALKRGRRLDESKPGTGLGLSIVTEISNEYQGRLELSRGEWGGLKAKLILPGVTKDVA